MSNNNRVKSLIGHYINYVFNEDINHFYGENSKINVMALNYVSTNKSIFVDCKLILGDNINENVLDDYVAKLLIFDALDFFYPNQDIIVNVTFDV